jgi:hypothetical protein
MAQEIVRTMDKRGIRPDVRGMRGYVLIQSVEDVDRYIGQIRKAAADAQTWMAAQTGDPLDLLRRMKFDMVGFHPIDGHALNLVEQIHQTWTHVSWLSQPRGSCWSCTRTPAATA